jgi:hypothetical protein
MPVRDLSLNDDIWLGLEVDRPSRCLMRGLSSGFDAES